MIRVTPTVKVAWDALPRPLNTAVVRAMIEQIVSPTWSEHLGALQTVHDTAIHALAERILQAMDEEDGDG